MNKLLFPSLMLCCTTALGVTQVRLFNFSPGVGAPVTTTSAEPLKQGTWGISARGEFVQGHPLSDALLSQDFLTDTFESYYIHFLIANYGLTDHIITGVALPYAGINYIRDAHWDKLHGIPEVSFQGN